MMSPVELELALRRWGWRYGERPVVEPAETAKTPDVHPIARAMAFGSKYQDKRLAVSFRRRPRDGEKLWSRDPVACVETRPAAGRAPEAPVDDIPDRVQFAWLELRRVSFEPAEALRLEYQVRDGQREKAKAMKLTRGKYRELLAEGRGWIAAHFMRRAA
jgi:predicted DNA-binding protein (UPF0251 family)